MAVLKKALNPVIRGDTWKIKLTIQEDNAAADITGYQYWFTMKEDIDKADTSAAIQEVFTAAGADAAAGIMVLTIPATATELVSPGYYLYDIQQKNLSGEIQTLMIGQVLVESDVTRSTTV